MARARSRKSLITQFPVALASGVSPLGVPCDPYAPSGYEQCPEFAGLWMHAHEKWARNTATEATAALSEPPSNDLAGQPEHPFWGASGPPTPVLAAAAAVAGNAPTSQKVAPQPPMPRAPTPGASPAPTAAPHASATTESPTDWTWPSAQGFASQVRHLFCRGTCCITLLCACGWLFVQIEVTGGGCAPGGVPLCYYDAKSFERARAVVVDGRHWSAARRPFQARIGGGGGLRQLCVANIGLPFGG